VIECATIKNQAGTNAPAPGKSMSRMEAMTQYGIVRLREGRDDPHRQFT